MKSYERLLSGYREFKANYLSEENREWLKVAGKRQEPQVMMIACSDSRVHPAILTRTALGELFMVRNVANIVPPFETVGDDSTYHGTSAAIEFAVNHLKVRHIIVMGHSGCGGIAALMDCSITEDSAGYSFIKPWMNIVSAASDFSSSKGENNATACEQRAILISLNNLSSFPWVKQGIESGTLRLHGWYFDIQTGTLSEYNEGADKFEEII